MCKDFVTINLPPSQSCGPFRSYSSNINGTEYVMFDTITNTIYSWPQIPQDIFYFLGTVGFFIPEFLKNNNNKWKAENALQIFISVVLTGSAVGIMKKTKMLSKI
ncbi:hypothetical protein KUTeg_003831 [Tegillarca granosa]|uniref:Uncharacterized protein n=1 Tax=Tegillarca granosa TaxID=220873 RepID=A0ABQ9FN98_TEGGR|nr:hypothetical protein KUTeg_003831 [Tegillarca granosa]